jgi:hypothetical protein
LFVNDIFTQTLTQITNPPPTDPQNLQSKYSTQKVNPTHFQTHTHKRSRNSTFCERTSAPLQQLYWRRKPRLLFIQLPGSPSSFPPSFIFFFPFLFLSSSRLLPFSSPSPSFLFHLLFSFFLHFFPFLSSSSPFLSPLFLSSLPFSLLFSSFSSPLLSLPFFFLFYSYFLSPLLTLPLPLSLLFFFPFPSSVLPLSPSSSPLFSLLLSFFFFPIFPPPYLLKENLNLTPSFSSLLGIEILF